MSARNTPCPPDPPMPARRRLCAGLACTAAGVTGAAPAADEVWLELSEPLPATADGPTQATRRRARVAAQQQQIGERLRELGIVELARLRHGRNAIAVRLAPGQAEQVRRLPGVLGLRPVESLHPPKHSI